jgi:2-polyprenylphenol 6-hydroxylase
MNQFDVIIVGGGPVGWACALACANAQINVQKGTQKKLNLCVIDRVAPPAALTGMIEPRVYTVTADNLKWLSSAGVSFDSARTSDVEVIRVFDQSSANALTIDTRDAKSMRLAAVIEHDALTAAIAARAMELGVQFIRGEANATGLLDQSRYVELDNRDIKSAKLVIVADGARSKLRDALGVHVLHRDYERVGVVAHLAVAQPHRFEARQWFLPDRSIFALLPLPDIDGRPAVSMVWSTTVAHGETLSAMNGDELANTVSAATGHRVDARGVLSRCVSFPLRLARVSDPVVERALVVGDAAHAIHPLAGQGVNLGFGDAQALAAMLAKASLVDGNCGHPLLLAKFRRSRYAAVLAMQTATDGLARIYNLNTSFLAGSLIAPATIGDLGMRLLGKLPAFRRFVSSAAS